MGACLKSHSSTVTDLEFKARSVTTHSDDEKNGGKNAHSSHFQRACRVPSSCAAVHEQDISVHSAHRYEDRVEGVMTSMCVRSTREAGKG